MGQIHVIKKQDYYTCHCFNQLFIVINYKLFLVIDHDKSVHNLDEKYDKTHHDDGAFINGNCAKDDNDNRPIDTTISTNEGDGFNEEHESLKNITVTKSVSPIEIDKFSEHYHRPSNYHSVSLTNKNLLNDTTKYIQK